MKRIVYLFIAAISLIEVLSMVIYIVRWKD